MNLTDVEGDVILVLFLWGDNIPANIGERAGRPASSVNYVLSTKDDSLTARGIVENKNRGVYTLTDQGEQLARDLLNPF